MRLIGALVQRKRELFIDVFVREKWEGDGKSYNGLVIFCIRHINVTVMKVTVMIGSFEMNKGI